MNDKPTNNRSQKSQEITGTAKQKEAETVNDQPKTTKSAKTKDNSKGIVVNCIALNVREKADTNATAVHILSEGTTVIIDFMESTEGFYKVTTIDKSVVGYCNRQYIQVM